MYKVIELKIDCFAVYFNIAYISPSAANNLTRMSKQSKFHFNGCIMYTTFNHYFFYI